MKHCWDPQKTLCLRCNAMVRDRMTPQGVRRFFERDDARIMLTSVDPMPPCIGLYKTEQTPRRGRTPSKKKFVKIYISASTLATLDAYIDGSSNRSAFLESLIVDFFAT